MQIHPIPSSQVERPSDRIKDSSGKADPLTLLDLFHDGFHLIVLLRERYVPTDGPIFRERLKNFLADVERCARVLQINSDDIHRAKFAFCALFDEVVLTSRFCFRGDWERNPLQLEIFGEHIAGDKFFELLELLREGGARHLQVLEVFHMCLLLGFRGRYILDEEDEKLSRLTSCINEELIRLRGRRPPIAPHWAPPDFFAHKLRREVPLWVYFIIFSTVALLAFSCLHYQLVREMDMRLGRHSDVISPSVQPAYLSITLP